MELDVEGVNDAVDLPDGPLILAQPPSVTIGRTGPLQLMETPLDRFGNKAIVQDEQLRRVEYFEIHAPFKQFLERHSGLAGPFEQEAIAVPTDDFERCPGF